MPELDRFELRIMGRRLGTTTGRDSSEFEIVWYNFIPDPGIPLHEGDLCINVEGGKFQYCNEGGDVAEELDAIPILSNISFTEAEKETP